MRPDRERELEPSRAERAGEAVAVHEDRGRALAVLRKLDALELPRLDVAHAVADAEAERSERAAHEKAVPVPHEDTERPVAGGRGRGPEGELRDALDRDAVRTAASNERQLVVLDEAAHGVAVREHDPREAALTAPEDDAR